MPKDSRSYMQVSKTTSPFLPLEQDGLSQSFHLFQIYKNTQYLSSSVYHSLLNTNKRTFSPNKTCTSRYPLRHHSICTCKHVCTCLQSQKSIPLFFLWLWSRSWLLKPICKANQGSTNRKKSSVWKLWARRWLPKYYIAVLYHEWRNYRA